MHNIADGWSEDGSQTPGEEGDTALVLEGDDVSLVVESPPPRKSQVAVAASLAFYFAQVGAIEHIPR